MNYELNIVMKRSVTTLTATMGTSLLSRTELELTGDNFSSWKGKLSSLLFLEGKSSLSAPHLQKLQRKLIVK